MAKQAAGTPAGDARGSGKKRNRDQSGYYQDWYAKNKLALSEKRKARYRQDSEYRQDALDRSREWWLKQPREPRERDATWEPKKRYMTPRTVRFGRGANAVTLEVISSGMFAQAIGYSMAAVTEWRLEGVLPPPTMKDSVGRYWYSEDYTNMVNKVLDSMKMEPWNKKTFTTRVWEEFKDTVGRGVEYAGRREETRGPARAA